jgi:hypothetical protein
MKKLLIGASVLMMLAACGASNPEDAVTGFFEAMKAGDGAKAVTYLSQSTIDEIGSGLEEIKADTTGMAAAMLPMMGINVTPEELQEMSAEDFVAALFSSQMMKDMLGTAEIEVVSSTVNGDAATVHVKMTMNGETDEEDLELVREGGAWKLNLPEFGM